MKLTSVLVFAAKVVGLTILYVVAFVLGGALFSPAARSEATQVNPANVFSGIVLMGLVDTLVITLAILRSRLSGWRLMLATGLSLYGVMTFMPQIETAWFASSLQIPAAWLPGLFANSLPIVAGFVPLAVLILGRGRAQPELDTPLPLPATITGWLWRVLLIAVLYVLLYFSFGFLIAWQNPELRAAYGNGADQSAFAMERLIPWQVFRGALWLVCGLPILRMTRGTWWQVGIVLGLWFAIPMNMIHMIPNTLMADSMRISHFIETTTSNFLFGFLMAAIMLWRGARAPRPLPQAAGVR